MLLDGRVLVNRYHVEICVGRGANSEVYRGHDTLLDRAVAMKLLSNGNAALRARFMAEARAMAVLSDAHIVSIYDFGEVDGFPYILMEYVDGKNLREALQADKLSFPSLLGVFRAICTALETAHLRSIIHRDLKPANVLLGKTGDVKVTDFGLARRVSDLTKEQEAPEVAGTMAYMPPECFLGKTMDARGDLYSVGIMMYEAFTGSLPFVVEKHDLLAMIYAHVNEVPIPPRALNRQIPITLERLILRLLQKDPEARYQSSREVGERLAELEPQMLETGAGPAEPLDPSIRTLLDRMHSPQRGAKEALGRIVSAMLATNRLQYSEATALYLKAIEEFRSLKNEAEVLKAALHLGECLLLAAADESTALDLTAVKQARAYLSEAGSYAYAKGLRQEFERCERLANALESAQIKRSS